MNRFPSALAAILLIAAAAPASAQDDDERPSVDDTPHITATGSATATLAPDIARLSLGVTTERPSAAEAARTNAEAAQRIIDAAKAAGVATSDLTTIAVSLFPVNEMVRQPDGTSKQEMHGFRATYILAVDVRDMAKAGALAQTLIDKGANQFNGLTFRVEHPEAALDKLRASAMRDAKRQAGILADAAGVKLGRLLQVEPPDCANGSPVNSRVMSMSAPMPVEAGQQTLRAEIEATYEIQP